MFTQNLYTTSILSFTLWFSWLGFTNKNLVKSSMSIAGLQMVCKTHKENKLVLQNAGGGLTTNRWSNLLETSLFHSFFLKLEGRLPCTSMLAVSISFLWSLNPQEMRALISLQCESPHFSIGMKVVPWIGMSFEKNCQLS